MAFNMLIDEGDTVLVERPTYSGALANLRPLGANIVGVETDDNGLVPAALEEVLNQAKANGVMPKLLYVIPTGQNPSGSTAPTQQRREIYRLCQEHNLIILEDDPYFYLRFENSDVTSYFSLDTDGRVLRFDSMSKVLSSGVRLGWVTGPPELVHRMELHMQSDTLHVSGMSQAIVAALLEAWGEDGWATHLDSVRSLYRSRRDAFCSMAERHLGGYATWTVPKAGFFVWFKLLGVSDTRQLIIEKALAHKVVLVPGQVFSPEDEPGPYVRAAYSVGTEARMEEGLRRLASLIEHL